MKLQALVCSDPDTSTEELFAFFPDVNLASFEHIMHALLCQGVAFIINFLRKIASNKSFWLNNDSF